SVGDQRGQTRDIHLGGQTDRQESQQGDADGGGGLDATCVGGATLTGAVSGGTRERGGFITLVIHGGAQQCRGAGQESGGTCHDCGGAVDTVLAVLTDDLADVLLAAIA